MTAQEQAQFDRAFAMAQLASVLLIQGLPRNAARCYVTAAMLAPTPEGEHELLLLAAEIAFGLYPTRKVTVQ